MNPRASWWLCKSRKGAKVETVGIQKRRDSSCQCLLLDVTCESWPESAGKIREAIETTWNNGLITSLKKHHWSLAKFLGDNSFAWHPIDIQRRSLELCPFQMLQHRKGGEQAPVEDLWRSQVKTELVKTEQSYGKSLHQQLGFSCEQKLRNPYAMPLHLTLLSPAAVAASFR